MLLPSMLTGLAVWAKRSVPPDFGWAPAGNDVACGLAAAAGARVGAAAGASAAGEQAATSAAPAPRPSRRSASRRFNSAVMGTPSFSRERTDRQCHGHGSLHDRVGNPIRCAHDTWA